MFIETEVKIGVEGHHYGFNKMRSNHIRFRNYKKIYPTFINFRFEPKTHVRTCWLTWGFFQMCWTVVLDLVAAVESKPPMTQVCLVLECNLNILFKYNLLSKITDWTNNGKSMHKYSKILVMRLTYRIQVWDHTTKIDFNFRQIYSIKRIWDTHCYITQSALMVQIQIMVH